MDGKAIFNASISSTEGPIAALRLLDSTDIKTVNDLVESIKAYEKEPWLIESLIQYFLSTESPRAAELIVSHRGDHEKLIFKKLHQAFDETSTRRPALKMLLLLVAKKPPWLHKIVNEALLQDCIKCLKHDNDVPLLMDSVYIITMLLPVAPDGMIKWFNDIIDIFFRLTRFIYDNKENTPEIYLLHLKVGLYSLFSRLYGLYPWHFIHSLQGYYNQGKITCKLFNAAIEPMLLSVKFHPALVMSLKERESRGDLWRSKEVHDIVSECANLTLDSSESTQDYSVPRPSLARRTNFDTVSKPSVAVSIPDEAQTLDNTLTDVELRKDSLLSLALDSSNFFSPSDRLGLSTPPVHEMMTPSALPTSHFVYSTPPTATPLQNVGPIRTPNNSNQLTPQEQPTPQEYTPKETPTYMDESSLPPRSRHASGNKAPSSRLSCGDDMVPPSPLRKEFTSVPPNDVPRVTSVSVDGFHDTHNVSLKSLPQILEQITDKTAAHHDRLESSNSEDEEVSSINNLLEPLTTKSVAEFMKNANRIRFNSYTTHTESDTLNKPITRTGSCPSFTKEPSANSSTDTQTAERSASIQTKSSTDLTRDSPTGSHRSEASSQHTLTQDSRLTSTIGIAYHPITELAPKSYTEVAEEQRHTLGPRETLDQCIRLGAEICSQTLERNLMSHSAVNWSHYGGGPHTDELNITRGQLLLLHTQLIYERQKRELHAERNRRLLSKVVKAVKNEEQQETLKMQYKKSQEDIFNLETTIRLQNSEIHRLRQEKAKQDAQREEQFQQLIKEDEKLKYSKEELQRDFDKQRCEFEQKCQELRSAEGQVESLERDLAYAREKISKGKMLEEEIAKLKKDMLLMGEIQIKYDEKLSSLKYDNQRITASTNEDGFLREIERLTFSLDCKNEEMRLKQAQIEALEREVKHKEIIIAEQNKLSDQVKGEHQSKLQACLEKYAMSQSTCKALEVEMLRLYDQIGRLTVPPPKQLQAT